MKLRERLVLSSLVILFCVWNFSFSTDQSLADVDVVVVKSLTSHRGGEGIGKARRGSEAASNLNEAHIVELEKEVSFWAQPNADKAFFWGSKMFFSMYLKSFKAPLKDSGFRISNRPLSLLDDPAITLQSAKSSAAGTWVCLAHASGQCWKNLDSFFAIPEHTPFNHVPYLKNILWNKAEFCRTTREASVLVPHLKEMFMPCWTFPGKHVQLDEYRKEHPDRSFLAKPFTEGAGIGIKILNSDDDISALDEKRKGMLVQPLFLPGFLIHGSKWDIRLYVLITGVSPLRLYLYHRGLVRVAGQELGESTADRAQLLTNTHVANRASGKGAAASTLSFSDLRALMLERGIDDVQMFKNVRASLGSVFLAAEHRWVEALENRSCFSCYQLLGVDALVDEALSVRIIEVNSQPSLVLNKKNITDHYSQTKLSCIHDMTNLVHNKHSVQGMLSEMLSHAPAEDVEMLSDRELKYLIKYVNERRALGGFVPVYPAADLAQVFDLFFQASTMFADRRRALHRVLNHIEANYLVDVATF